MPHVAPHHCMLTRIIHLSFAASFRRCWLSFFLTCRHWATPLPQRLQTVTQTHRPLLQPLQFYYSSAPAFSSAPALGALFAHLYY